MYWIVQLYLFHRKIDFHLVKMGFKNTNMVKLRFEKTYFLIKGE